MDLQSETGLRVGQELGHNSLDLVEARQGFSGVGSAALDSKPLMLC